VSGGGYAAVVHINRTNLSVAGKARNLVEHPSVSDYQLTALHTCVMTPAACCTMFRREPWYQRFGLDHNQQLLDALLPWYGVANNRLIRDPANAALAQKLTRWQLSARQRPACAAGEAGL
jgi:type VI secretion system protein ImpL